MNNSFVSFFAELCLNFFLPFIFIINLVVAKNPKLKRKLRQETLPPVLSIFFLALSLIMPISFSLNVAGYITLITLKPSQVASITVGDHTFTDREDINKIISSINHSTWSYKLLGENHESSMRLEFFSGKRISFTLVIFDKLAQARLDGTTYQEDNGIPFSRVNVISPELSNVLRELGVK